MSAAETDQHVKVSEPAPLPRFKRFNRADAFGGYSLYSLIVHWVGFLVVGFLAYMLIEQGWYENPPPLDVAIGIFLLYQCIRRYKRGFPRNANTWLPAAFLYRMAQIAMLSAIGIFALAGLALILFTGQATATIFGLVIFELPNETLPWWQGQAQMLYRASSLAFAGGAGITVLAVLHYLAQRGMPNLKRLFLPSTGGR
ncbi:MAG: hypothetical protein AAFY99_03060 [Pseudomonadota bacterium]